MAPPITGSPRSWPWWRCVLTGLCALGLVLSAYLGWHHLMGGSVIGCSGGSGCDQVLSSRWSAVRGVVPVSGLAAGAYLAMLMASFFIGPRTAAPDRRLAWGAILVLVGAAAGSAVWFIIVQKWFIGSFCPYCMATHITGLVLAGLVIWRAPMRQDVARRVVGRGPALGLGVLGLGLAGTVAVFQGTYVPPAVYRSGEVQAASRPALNGHTVPLVGSADAPYLVKLFFDYKCPHCQHLHTLLEDAIDRYDGQVAFVLCPAPLNRQCNPYVARDVEAFADSCELARLSLAVWVADRAAFGNFDRWMFGAGPEGNLWHARSLEEATAKAVELVGQAKLDAARKDPWIDQYMQASMELYGDTIQGGNAVPKLVFGPRWVTPELYNADDLVLLLQDTLKVPKP